MQKLQEKKQTLIKDSMHKLEETKKQRLRDLNAKYNAIRTAKIQDSQQALQQYMALVSKYVGTPYMSERRSTPSARENQRTPSNHKAASGPKRALGAPLPFST